ncbi:2Fe-2S ferredoxin-like protein [Stenotrophomonas maltophilia]|uniref:class I ribonucleotide reductase maintenance protein YfaE n=1 Tax=Stenotrophomonas maltophilia TaxID=40324 RepID=UPI0021C953DC|nr:class I ribonucleotide reductase maintenance protein YfaE [Stenotrophomonas maltophilia]MCU1038045.1 2Fe-2S ferredoxin-like protein [Stenotrophomonas maltophilia]
MILVKTTTSAFQLKAEANLLAALERTGHAVEYQCRSGYCGSCRLKILSGTVTYKTKPLAALAPDEILPCCCVVSESITLACESVTLPAGGA